MMQAYRKYLDDIGIPKPKISNMKNGTQIQTQNKRPYTTNPLDSRYGDPPGGVNRIVKDAYLYTSVR
jgi:hypothetical protein